MIEFVKRWFLVSLFLIFGLSKGHAADVSDSVVQIFAIGEVVTEVGLGSGFVWQGKHGKYIVTSLHTLAGAESIYYKKGENEVDLEVYKIDKESDLALLKAKSGSIDLPALPLGDEQPVEDRVYKIYGYPGGIRISKSERLFFSGSTEQNVPMKDILSYGVVRSVTDSGYPQSSVKLLILDDSITPGHSGAPIVDPNDDNKVIGIGQGGLSNIGLHHLDWAVHAKTYLPKLEERGVVEDIAHMAVSKVKSRFSVPAGAVVAPLEGERSKFYHIGQASLEDVLESVIDDRVDEEEQWFSRSELNDIKDNAKKNDYDLTVAINLFKNKQTGAMVYVPANIPRSKPVMEDNGLLVFDAGRVRMYMQAIKGNNFSEAMANKDQFVRYLYGKESDVPNWKIDKASKWTYEDHKPEKGSWEQSEIRYVPPLNDPRSGAEIYGYIDYNDKVGRGNFFGLAIVWSDYDNWTEKGDKKISDDDIFFWVDAAGWVSGFVPK
jgi:hypothetical protein